MNNINIDYLGTTTYNQNVNNSKKEFDIPDGKYNCMLEELDIKEIPTDWNKRQKHQLIIKFSIIENSSDYDSSQKGKCFYINHHIPYGQNDPDFDKLIIPLQISCSFINPTFNSLQDFLNSDLSQNTGGIYQVLIQKKNNYIAKYIKAKLRDAEQPAPINPPDPFASNGNINIDPFAPDGNIGIDPFA